MAIISIFFRELVPVCKYMENKLEIRGKKIKHLHNCLWNSLEKIIHIRTMEVNDFNNRIFVFLNKTTAAEMLF